MDELVSEELLLVDDLGAEGKRNILETWLTGIAKGLDNDWLEVNAISDKITRASSVLGHVVNKVAVNSISDTEGEDSALISALAGLAND